jgi:hypothetical protein
MIAKPQFLSALSESIGRDSVFGKRLAAVAKMQSTLHLGIFVEPYLSSILEGRKTIESRFSTRRFAPYGKVQSGDLVLLKASAGPIAGLFIAENVWNYEVDPDGVAGLRKRFGEGLCISDEEFWHRKSSSAYATLIQIGEVTRISPLPFVKRDRRGWVVLSND